jgi:hypothetical protein
MDIIDDIIGLFYRHNNAHLTADGECEVFIGDEIEFRKGLEKLLTEK